MSQGSNYPYCNVTSDLQRAYADIERYNNIDTLDDWQPTTGQSSTYEMRNTGHYGAVYDDGTELTVQTSIANVESNAGSWYYDETNDVLYVHPTSSTDPVNSVMTAGIDDWKSYKEQQRNDAMEMVESLVDPAFPRPLPFSRDSYSAQKYDFDIRHSCALLTCYLIISNRSPDDAIAQRLYDQVWNPVEESGILWEHRTGQRAFSFETTADDFDGRLENITYDTNSTGRVYVQRLGNMTTDHGKYRVKISTGGAVETAEYQISDDNGNEYSNAAVTEYGWVHLVGGIYIRFEGTFVADDEWLIELYGDREKTNGRLYTVTLRRS